MCRGSCGFFETMRYSILDFNQNAILGIQKEVNGKTLSLDIADLHILKWVAEMNARETSKKIIVGGSIYVWICYKNLLEDLPVLGIGKRALTDRMGKYVELGLLKHHHETQMGSFSFYSLTDMYESLLYTNDGGCEANFIGGMQSTSEQRLNNNNIKENVSIDTQKNAEELLKEREEKFKAEVFAYNQYPEFMLQNFIRYWTETNKSKTKMRFEMEKTWETSKRLATWASRNNLKPSAPSPRVSTAQSAETPKWKQFGYPSEEAYNQHIAEYNKRFNR